MPLELSTASRVLVDLRATGLLKAVAHDPTLTAHPGEAVAIEHAQEGARFVVRFPVRGIEPPPDLDAGDRHKMLDNLCSAEVLDEARHPTIEARLRYAGTPDGGRVEGELVVRGSPRPFAMDVRGERAAERILVRGAWEGTLTDLGVKPFKALLGAIKLRDWIRLRLEGVVLVKTSSTP